MTAKKIIKVGCDLNGPRGSPEEIWFMFEDNSASAVPALRVYEDAAEWVASLSDRGRERIATYYADALANQAH